MSLSIVCASHHYRDVNLMVMYFMRDMVRIGWWEIGWVFEREGRSPVPRGETFLGEDYGKDMAG